MRHVLHFLCWDPVSTHLSASSTRHLGLMAQGGHKLILTTCVVRQLRVYRGVVGCGAVCGVVCLEASLNVPLSMASRLLQEVLTSI